MKYTLTVEGNKATEALTINGKTYERTWTNNGHGITSADADDWGYGKERYNQTECIMHYIENMPSIQPKKGKWIDTRANEEWYAREYRCSECGDTMLGEANFCPNCGADMREEAEC